MLRASALLACLGSVAIVAFACRRNDVADRPNAPAQSQSEPVQKLLNLTPGAAPAQSRFANDSLWHQAAALHEIDLMRLANREAALGLLEGVELGRTVGVTGLAALPHAQDAELALPRLCELMSHMGANPELDLLVAVHAISGQPPKQREPLAPQAHEFCLPIAQKLARRPDIDAHLRDLASSTVQLLIEHRDAAKR